MRARAAWLMILQSELLHDGSANVRPRCGHLDDLRASVEAEGDDGEYGGVVKLRVGHAERKRAGSTYRSKRHTEDVAIRVEGSKGAGMHHDVIDEHRRLEDCGWRVALQDSSICPRLQRWRRQRRRW